MVEKLAAPYSLPSFLQCNNKMAQYWTGFVTDGQNVTHQVKEGEHDVTSDNTSILRQGWTCSECSELVSECHRYEMSQWTKCLVNVSFKSKCSVNVPLVDVLSMHRC
jgi:hypothetical protein